MLFLLLATNLVTAVAANQQLARTCQNKITAHKIGLQESMLYVQGFVPRLYFWFCATIFGLSMDPAAEAWRVTPTQ